MNTVFQGNHWVLEDEGGLVTASLDVAESQANTLGSAVMAEMATWLDQLASRRPRALIIRSAKSAGFVAGADIDEFTRIETAEAARALVTRGWELFNRLAAVPYPTLALVQGHCMGGGLELALACRYVMVVDAPETRLSLPEVMLGIVPGWGGMLRLPQRVGPQAALDMMLTGKGVDARRAGRMGLADAVVPPRLAAQAAARLVLSGKSPRRAGGLARLLNGPLKMVVEQGALKQLARRARREHYPAPYAIVEIWARHAGNALAVPANSAASLETIFQSPTARNLVRVFKLQERLKGFGKASTFRAGHVHVIGAGTMGGDIAAWCALKGLTVTLQDQSFDRIAPALARAAKLFSRRLKQPRLASLARDRLLADPEGHGVDRADVVIEAIFEDLDAKRSLFAALEGRLKAGALLATNTSSLRLEDIATALQTPARLIGLHFFNPVALMPLVEIVEGEQSDGKALADGAAFIRQIDKLPLPVKSAPGFLVNAVLAPYLQEAMRCVEEGQRPETVDEAATGFGMPMGPIELADTVGLDIAVAAGKTLADGSEPPKRLLERVAAGNLGKKTGKGYYVWKDGKAVKGEAGAVGSDMAARIINPLVAATRDCVARGVVADDDLADAGVIFGTGFAPFRGGPLHSAAP